MKTTKYLLALILSLLFAHDSVFAQWSDLNPWNTAKITGIEIVDSTYYVATENGIWRSQDSMQTWQRINQGLPKLKISKLFANDKVAIATIDSVGVFLSKDKGNTWTKSDFKHNNLIFSDIDSDNSFIYLVSYGALYSSSDNGETWSDTLLTTWIGDIKCIGNDIFCATLGGGIYYSSNQGKNWEYRNSGIQNFNIISIDGNDQFLFAATEQHILADVYLSTNKGINWTKLNKDFQDENVFIWPLTTAIVSDSLLYVRDITGTIYKTTNLGKNWIWTYNTGNGYEFEFKKHKDYLFMGTKEHQLEFHSKINSNENKGFSLIAPQNKYINSLHSTGNNLLVGSNKGILYSKNSGSDLTQNYFFKDNSNVFTSEENLVYALNTRNNNTPTYLYSQNNGETWDTTNFDFAGGNIINLNKYQDTLCAISEYAYAYSVNKGKDWSQTINHRSFVRFLNANEDSWYYLRTKDTSLILTLSLDKGRSFIDLVDLSNNDSLNGNIDYIRQLFISKYTVYLRTSSKVYLLTNATNQLLDLTKNLPVIKDMVTIRYMFVGEETIYCLLYNSKMSSYKLYYLTDMNSQWQEFTNKKNAILGSKLYADDKYLYSFDQRFYRTELSNFKSMSVAIDSQTENPVVISLAQDILSFNLLNELNSSIEIYNSLGKTMYSQNSIESINLSNFANGVYFAKIQTNGKTVVNKFVKY